MSYRLDIIPLSAPKAGENDAITVLPAAAGVDNRKYNNADSIASVHAEPPSSHAAPAEYGIISKADQKLSSTTIALTMTSLCLSALLSALDITIVTTAVPAIAASFKSQAGYIWVGSAYILAQAAITPVWGSVSNIWGRKPIMLLAVAIFLLGSLVCALGPDIQALIIGRVFQGLGASGMGTMVNVVICDMFSLREIGLYLAITSVVWAVGGGVGRIIGGVFTTRLNWRWCFWLNLPIGAVVFVVLIFFMKVPNPKTPVLAGLKAIDWTGSIFVIGGALMILLGLDFGNVEFPWSSATIVSLITFGAVAVGIFIVNEWKFATTPIIPLRLFSTISTAAAYAVFSCNAYVFIGLTYYLPLYSQSVLGADAPTSGIYLLPLVVSTSLAAAFGGIIIQQTGKYRPLMYVAQATLTLGVGLLLNLEFEKNLTKLFVFEIIVGIGAGMNLEAPILAAQAASTSRDTAAVNATMSFVRSIATTISIVIGGVVFQNEMNVANPGLVDQLGKQLALRFNGDQASANIEAIKSLSGDQQVVVRQTYFRSLRTVWIMYVTFAGLASVLNLFVRAHHLSSENKGAVLGIDRAKAVTGQEGDMLSRDAIELVEVHEEVSRT